MCFCVLAVRFACERRVPERQIFAKLRGAVSFRFVFARVWFAASEAQRCLFRTRLLFAEALGWCLGMFAYESMYVLCDRLQLQRVVLGVVRVCPPSHRSIVPIDQNAKALGGSFAKNDEQGR